MTPLGTLLLLLPLQSTTGLNSHLIMDLPHYTSYNASTTTAGESVSHLTPSSWRFWSTICQLCTASTAVDTPSDGPHQSRAGEVAADKSVSRMSSTAAALTAAAVAATAGSPEREIGGVDVYWKACNFD